MNLVWQQEWLQMTLQKRYMNSNNTLIFISLFVIFYSVLEMLVARLRIAVKKKQVCLNSVKLISLYSLFTIIICFVIYSCYLSFITSHSIYSVVSSVLVTLFYLTCGSYLVRLICIANLIIIKNKGVLYK